MFKRWLIKFLGLDDLQRRCDALERELQHQRREREKFERVDVDAGFRGQNTVILTGVYRGRGYVQFYDVGQAEFLSLVEEYRQRRKNDPRVRNIDAPPNFIGSFPLTP